jgi:magnesium and cobalt transporter
VCRRSAATSAKVGTNPPAELGPPRRTGALFPRARGTPRGSAILLIPQLPHVLHPKAVSDPHPARLSDKEDKRTFLQKIAEFIHPGPDSKAELIETLADAEDNDIIGAESRVMLEGVIRMAEMSAGDVMVAAPRMDLIDIDSPYDDILHLVIDTAHSRFPVYEGDRENIIGILLAKDLLKLQRAPELNIRALLRAAVFVPETKGLNDLLREFRGNRNHLAIVIDEFGRVAGLITIEDVLEQIVGEIEDEFDIAEDEGDIFGLADKTYRVSGDTSIERVAEAFEVDLHASDEEQEFDTIGGLIAHEMGHVPKRGEEYVVAGLKFVVLHTKGGAVRWFKVSPAALDHQPG